MKHKPFALNLYYQDQILQDITASLKSDQEYSYLSKPLHLSKVLHLISYLYLIPVINKSYEEQNDFVYLSSKFLTELYGKKFYRSILEVLLKYGIIEKNQINYKVGERTNSYRISPQYYGLKFKTIPCEFKLAKKYINLVKERNQKNSGNFQRVHTQLEITLRSITIEFEAASDYILNQLVYSLENPETIKLKKHRFYRKGKFRPKKKLKDENIIILHTQLTYNTMEIVGERVNIRTNYEQHKRVMGKYFSQMKSINRIHNGGNDFSFTVDHTGRVHTNLTNLPRELRQFIRLDGKKITGRDLVSSQPVFLACLLLARYKEKEMPDDVFKYIQICLEGEGMVLTFTGT